MAASYSDRYISGRFLPDKAIDLLDTACARVKVNLSAKPAELEDKERSLQALDRQKKGLERDRVNGIDIDQEEYDGILAKIEQTTGEAEEIKAHWLKEKEAAAAVLAVRDEIQALAPEENDKKTELKVKLGEADQALVGIQGDNPMISIEVSPDVVAQVVADWTGIPVGKMLRDEADTVVHLEDHLKDRIKGQDMALAAIAEGIRSSKAGIKAPGTPMGVFLLVGPSGVGKTESGLALAELLFGGERNVVTINMSEFQEKLFGQFPDRRGPGLVGYGEGGRLTEAVRQQPYSVVLLDESEKAHIDVMNLFLPGL